MDKFRWITGQKLRIVKATKNIAFRNGIIILAFFLMANWVAWSFFNKNTVSTADYTRMQNHTYRGKVEYVRNAKGLIFIRTKETGDRIFFHKGEYTLYHAQGEIEDLVFTGDSIFKNAWSDTIAISPAKTRQAAFDNLLIVNDFEKMRQIWLKGEFRAQPRK